MPLAYCAEGKPRAAAQYRKKRLKPFHIERWDLAHRATDYDRWTTAKDFYDIEYEHVSFDNTPVDKWLDDVGNPAMLCQHAHELGT